MTSEGKTDSLRRRYLFKLLANVLGFAISLVTQSIIPRTLGPKLYGDFSYLSNVATQIVTFFDMGTSVGFYTKVSQRPKEPGLVAFYLIFALGVSVVVLLLVLLAQLTTLDAAVWPGQTISFVYLSALWAILTWYSQIVGNMGDAYGLTLPIEKCRIAQKVLGLILVGALVLCRYLGLTTLFLVNCASTLFFVGGMLWILNRAGHPLTWKPRGEELSLRSYGKEFYSYSRPLFIYFTVALAVGILDRWLLQVFCGSVQQGFYGLSVQIGSVCFLFTSAMASLMIREFSIAYTGKDFVQMAFLFRRYIPLFYGIAAFLSCFVAVQADSVAYLFGGAKYHGAALAIAIMAIFQIHQTYGMLSGAVFMASGQTALYSKIGIIFNVIGIPLSYFLVAPASRMGLDAGATGLAVKMALVQCLAVNVHLYYNCRFLKLNFSRYLGHQVVSVLFFLAAAGLCVLAVDQVELLGGSILGRFLVSGVLYTLMVTGLLYFVPVLLGLYREDVSSVRQLVVQKVWSRVNG